MCLAPSHITHESFHHSLQGVKHRGGGDLVLTSMASARTFHSSLPHWPLPLHGQVTAVLYQPTSGLLPLNGYRPCVSHLSHAYHCSRFFSIMHVVPCTNPGLYSVHHTRRSPLTARLVLWNKTSIHTSCLSQIPVFA